MSIVHPKDISGLPYGMLIAKRFIETLPKLGAMWEFECQCGKLCVKRRSAVLSGNTHSCGCDYTKNKSNHRSWKGCGELSGTHWNHILYNAKQNGIPVSITIEEAWELFLSQNRLCALSGLLIHFASTTGGRGWSASTTASLDRIDSGLGYIHGNVQWLHKDVNFMKRTLSVARLVELCSLIAEKAK